MCENSARGALRAMGLLRESHGRTWLEVQTSGTTDRPRTVVRSVASWVDSFEHLSRATGTTGADRVLVPAPPTGSMFAFAIAHAAHLGADVVTLPRWSLRDAEAALASCTVAHLTPAMLAGLLGRDPGVLRTAVCAGSLLPQSLRDHALAAGVQVVDYYGAAELSFVAIRSGERLVPFPQVEVEVRDGVIWARSPWLCEGYAPGQSGPLRRSAGGWATVGDLGRLDDGELLVLGRDDTVSTGGATVVCADVEAALRACVGVVDAVVVGTPHPHLGELLEVVVLAPSATDLAMVRSEAARLLAPTHLPRRWHHWTNLPLTSAGKVDRSEVGRRLTAGRGSAVTS